MATTNQILASILAIRQRLRILDQSDQQLIDMVIARASQTNMRQEEFLFHSSFFFEIPSYFDVLPFLIVGTPITMPTATTIPATTTIPTTATRPTNNSSFSNLQYWQITHPYLTDDDNPHTSFRAMYRMNRASFEKLVNDLSQHPEFQFTAHNATPVYIQISAAIWRLANSHIGYKTMNVGWGVSNGSYINFFRRFLIALEGVYGRLISWPTDIAKVRRVHQAFENPPGENTSRRLPNVIGAIDGKNVIIETPREQPEMWRDRKNHFAMKLSAVCDGNCRFTSVRVGDSGMFIIL